MTRCEFCGGGTVGWDPAKPRNGCNTVDCPGNQETPPTEDPRLLKAIHDAVVAEACRWRGIPKPTACGEFVRISDVWRYARVALAEVRRFEADAREGRVMRPSLWDWFKDSFSVGDLLVLAGCVWAIRYGGRRDDWAGGSIWAFGWMQIMRISDQPAANLREWFRARRLAKGG